MPLRATLEEGDLTVGCEDMGQINGFGLSELGCPFPEGRGPRGALALGNLIPGASHGAKAFPEDPPCSLGPLS